MTKPPLHGPQLKQYAAEQLEHVYLQGLHRAIISGDTGNILRYRTMLLFLDRRVARQGVILDWKRQDD